MDKYIAISVDNKIEFDKLQLDFLNKGFSWIDNKKTYRDIYMFKRTFLIDYDNKKIAIHNIEDKYPYIEKSIFTIEKLITYKQFINQIRIEKFKKINHE